MDNVQHNIFTMAGC